MHKQCTMRTVNRSPVSVCKGQHGLSITWECHGLDQDGQRQYWTEYGTTIGDKGMVITSAPMWTGRSHYKFQSEDDESEGSE